MVPHARRRAPTTRPAGPAHLLELHLGGHLLGDQRGLDPVEQALEPADELGLGDRAARPSRAARRRRTARRGGRAPRAARARAPSRARAATRRGSRAGARGWRRRGRCPRTSSSSCLIIMPMRMTFAGSSTAPERSSLLAARRPRHDLAARRPRPPGIAHRADRLAVGSDDHDLVARRWSPVAGASLMLPILHPSARGARPAPLRAIPVSRPPSPPARLLRTLRRHDVRRRPGPRPRARPG